MAKRAAYKNNSSSYNTTKLSKIDVWWREKQFMTRGQFVSEKSKGAVEPSIKIDIHNITTMLHSRAHMFICYAVLPKFIKAIFVLCNLYGNGIRLKRKIYTILVNEKEEN